MDSHRPTMPDDPALVGYQPNPAASPGSFPRAGRDRIYFDQYVR